MSVPAACPWRCSADRYLATAAHQSASTLEQKGQICERIKKEWPGGSHVAIGKVTPSSVATWLASYRFGASNHNHHLLFIRGAFQMAVDDKLLAHSPAAGIVQRKREKPIRRTPTFQEFQSILADVRAQVHNADHQDSANFPRILGTRGFGAGGGQLTALVRRGLAERTDDHIPAQDASGVCGADLPAVARSA